MVLPPVLFYFLGVILLLFGGLRAYYFGLRKSDRVRTNEDEEAGQRRAKEKRRHVFMGAIWVVMGLVLIVSTMRAPRQGRVEPQERYIPITAPAVKPPPPSEPAPPPAAPSTPTMRAE